MPSASISEADQQYIKQAVERAEKLTSGEIRICIENVCPLDVLDRAAFIFKKLGIHNTKERNGILIYLSLKDHKYAIIGDAGIHRFVKQEFWDEVGNEMIGFFKKGMLKDGLIHAVDRASEKLSQYFPLRQNDRNELPNQIHFGDSK